VQLTTTAEQKIISDPEWGNWQRFQEYLNRNERRIHPAQGKEIGAPQFKLRAGNAVMRLSRRETPYHYVAIDVYRQAQPEREYLERWKENPFELLSEAESVIVDGSNLAKAGRKCKHEKHEKCNNPGLVGRLSQLLELAEKRKRTTNVKGECIVVVDASLRHHVDEKTRLESLIDDKMIIQAPSRTRADTLILELADEKNAAVLSNDSMEEYAPQFPFVMMEERFVRYAVMSDEGMRYVRKTQVQGDIVPSLIEILPPHRPKQQPNIIQRTRGWAERIQGILDIVPIWVVCPYCRAWNFMNPRATQSQLCQRCGHRLR
jgi:hypothetical protein